MYVHTNKITQSMLSIQDNVWLKDKNLAGRHTETMLWDRDGNRRVNITMISVYIMQSQKNDEHREKLEKYLIELVICSRFQICHLNNSFFCSQGYYDLHDN